MIDAWPGIRALLERCCTKGGSGPRETKSTSIATASPSIWSIESLPMRRFVYTRDSGDCKSTSFDLRMALYRFFRT